VSPSIVDIVYACLRPRIGYGIRVTWRRITFSDVCDIRFYPRFLNLGALFF
jgi:hypothetical protein